MRRTTALTLLLIFGTSMVPKVNIRTVNGRTTARVQQQLAVTRAAGYRVGRTIFSTVDRRSFGTVRADDYSGDGGYASVTVLDDGNPDDVILSVDARLDDGTEVWGTVGANAWDLSNPWVTDANMSPGRSASLFDAFSTTVEARPDKCQGGWNDARQVLIEAFGIGIATAGGALIPCVWTPAAGACIAGAFAGSFVGGLIWVGASFVAECRAASVWDWNYWAF